jgi:hypothetical protein
MTPPPDDEETGLPWLRSWGRVYGFVIVVLVALVGLLAVLTRAFS